MDVPEEGSVIDGFRLAEMIHAGSMATIFRLAGPDGALPLVMKIPRLGPGERAVNVIGFEVCRIQRLSNRTMRTTRASPCPASPNASR